MKTKVDMTQGKMMPLVLKFALPALVANILQLLYTTVDTWVVGNYCTNEALAAVGTSSQPVEIFLHLFTGLAGGVTIMVAQAAGAKDGEKIKKTVKTASSFLYFVAIPLTILGLLFGRFVLILMQVPAEAFSYALTYMQILFLGTLGSLGYNMNAGILRGIGDSISSLIFLIISSVMNIGLDLLFTAVWGMGVFGVAFATIIAQFVSWFSSMVYLKRRFPEIGYTPIPGKIDGDCIREELRTGLPLGFNNSVYSVGHTVLQTVINMQGVDFAAGATIGTKVISFATLATTAFSQAAMTYAGQNYGAHNYERLKRGHLRIPLFSALVAFIGGTVVTIFAGPIAGCFNKSAEVVGFAVRYVRVVLPFHWCYSIFNGIINYAHGVKEIIYPTIINVLALWAIRIPAAFILNACGLGGYCMAGISISFVCGMAGMLIYYLTPGWKRIMSGMPQNDAKCGAD